MSYEDDLMVQIRNAVVGHDARGRAILVLPEDAPPIVMDVPGMGLSGYGLGSPIEGCQCPYCLRQTTEIVKLPTFNPYPPTQP